jgi:hypothetical protein
MNKYFGRGLALSVIRDALAGAKTVRIATAFFEPSGFQLLSQVLSGKRVLLLIGREYGHAGGMEGVLREFVAGLMEGPLEERVEAMV